MKSVKNRERLDQTSKQLMLEGILAALGEALYSPITAIHPYGTTVLLLCFAGVIIGGMGNLRGTFFSSFVLGMVISLTARYWPAQKPWFL